jgi:hypothetical protein
VVFFERPGRLDGLCQALGRGPLSASADVVIVVSGPASSCPAAAVGYAVVDSTGAVRYRTLDPTAADELAEVATILAAVP